VGRGGKKEEDVSDEEATNQNSEASDAAKASARTSSREAKTEKSWWPGWIWGVPIAALVIVVWLLIRFLTQGGTDITIQFADVYGIDPKSTNIMCHGMKVGSVTDVTLTRDGGAVKVSANIKSRASKLLTTGTVFWLKGANVSLGNLSSLGSILSGPTLLMQPGPGKKERHFKGLTHKPLPADRGAPVRFIVFFEGAVGDLSDGDAVRLRGFSIGEVERIDFRYDAKSDEIKTPVTIALYPKLFHIQNQPLPDNADALRAALSELIEKGLRARLGRDPALIGNYEVSLEMIPGAPAATLNIVDNMPEIPTAPGGGLESLLNRVKGVPLNQIGQNLLDVTKHLDSIVASPKLKEAVSELDASLVEIHGLLTSVSPELDKLVQDLRNTAAQLDQTAAAADKVFGGAPSQAGLTDTLQELKDAARSIRSLADYLDRHPEALIKGRSGD
jgi:paraquat-inducible protein B